VMVALWDFIVAWPLAGLAALAREPVPPAHAYSG